MVFVTSVKFICNNPGFYKYYVTIETKLVLSIIVFVLIQKKHGYTVIRNLRQRWS